MLTPQQQIRIAYKEQHTPATFKRDLKADYAEGFFFVTLNVHERLPILGNMTGRYIAETKQVLEAGIRLTPLGDAVLHCWQQIPSFHTNVELIDAQVMPEHFHGLLRLHRQAGCRLGRVIQGFMIGCTHAYWDILGIEWRNMQGRRDGITDKRWTDYQHLSSRRGQSLFTSGYNDTIPITPEEVATKIAHIRSNPERRIIKGAARDCFAVYRNQRSAHWTEERARKGLLADALFAREPVALNQAWESIQTRLLRDDISPSGLSLSYVGKRDLLLHSRKRALVCHRADENRREEQTAAVLREAAAGAVIVSAFISTHERAIRDRLLQEGRPVIEILDNGISTAYKPSGNRFYYCAEGKLLQLTCWKYQYQRDTTVSRPMCMVMNELARLICGQEDDWWKK
ncbi:MAG: hypothetical protein ACI4BD_02090 [Paludibacteraceae bacterium]